ncbi:hypothetical protein Tco_0356005 [Tanacetum coccineum]
MSSSSSSSYRRYNQDVSNKTHCDCKPPHPIPIQTAWTTCYPGLVYSLHEENKALKRMNRMPVGVMDGTSGVVSNNSFGIAPILCEWDSIFLDDASSFESLFTVDELGLN